MTTFAPSDRIYFSTDSLPQGDRLPHWREVFGRSVLKLDFEPVDDRPFRQAVTLQVLEGLALCIGETDGIVGRRSRLLLADSNDDLFFTTNLSGSSLVSQLGREFTLGAGQAVMVSCGDVGSQTFPEPSRYVNLRVPLKALSSLVANPENALMRPVPANNEALRLLVDYVVMMLEKHELATPHLRQLFTTHVHDLVALAIGATRDAAAVAQDRGLRAARLNTIKSYVIDHIGNERLSVTDIAKRHGVTPRYVQMLFESDGRTLTEYVIQQRLARVYGMLNDPRFDERTIAAIAFDVGFNNLSYFNRTFRRTYGASPSDVRAAARREQ